MSSSSDPAAGGIARLAAEIFLMNAGPALVKTTASILAPSGIPVMALKGVLLQRLVYGEKSFRPIADVDLLVPAPRFIEACALLRSHGFTDERWEQGEWQVTLKMPKGPPLGIDLHRALTRTSRARLTAEAMFARGTRDTQLFDAPIVVPSDDDLFAHLLLHATLHWINVGTLHRADDFEALAEARGMEPRRCARHLTDQGMAAHARLMLPLLAAGRRNAFVLDLLRCMPNDARARITAGVVRALGRRYAPGTPGRRAAGLALAPSITGSVLAALLDRTKPRPAGRIWAQVARPGRKS